MPSEASGLVSRVERLLAQLENPPDGVAIDPSVLTELSACCALYGLAASREAFSLSISLFILLRLSEETKETKQRQGFEERIAAARSRLDALAVEIGKRSLRFEGRNEGQVPPHEEGRVKSKRESE